MTLYLIMLFCYAMMPLSLITGQGLFIPVLMVIVLLLRRVMVLEQQVAYLLHQSEVRQMRSTLQGRDIGLKPLNRVKEI